MANADRVEPTDEKRKADKSITSITRQRGLAAAESEAAHYSDLSSADISIVNGRNENTGRKKC